MESLQHRRWYRKLCCFYKILKDQSPKYLVNLFPKFDRPYPTRNANNIPHFKIKHSFFKTTFFPSVIIEWNKLDPEIQNPHNIKGIKYLIRLWLRLSHLHEHKFKNNFQDTIHFVPVAVTLKIHVTSSSTVLISPLNEPLFTTKNLLILIVVF